MQAFTNNNKVIKMNCKKNQVIQVAVTRI